MEADSQGPPSASTALVLLQDLQESLQEFISSKCSCVSTATAQEGSQAPVTLAYKPAQQQQQAPAAPAPPALSIGTATRVAAAPPAVEIIEEVEEHVPPVDTADGGGGFGGLSPEFLKAMQDGLEALGYDLTLPDVVQVGAGKVQVH
jgi:hypothetical protein